MRMSATWRRSAALLVAAIAATGLVTVAQAGPASAGRCGQILTAGPGPTPGSVHVTFEATVGPYLVGATDKDLRIKYPPLIASAEGDPAGTDLGGLEPSTGYWIYVFSDDGSCASDGVWVVTAAAGASDLWVQAYARPTQTDACQPGWWGSYAQWPNGNRGGWTCERYVKRFG